MERFTDACFVPTTIADATQGGYYTARPDSLNAGLTIRRSWRFGTRADEGLRSRIARIRRPTGVTGLRG
jgi:hypothetical protein